MNAPKNTPEQGFMGWGIRMAGYFGDSKQNKATNFFVFVCSFVWILIVQKKTIKIQTNEQRIR